MSRDNHVNSQPQVHRVVRITYVEGGKECCSHWYARRNISRAHGALRTDMKHRTLVSIERAWAVSTSGYSQIWVHLEYAQAERNALNYHWARHIMTQGTPAEGTGI